MTVRVPSCEPRHPAKCSVFITSHPQAKNGFRNDWVLKVGFITFELPPSCGPKCTDSPRGPCCTSTAPSSCHSLVPGVRNRARVSNQVKDNSHTHSRAASAPSDPSTLCKWRLTIIQLYLLFELRKMTSLAHFKNSLFLVL